MGRRTKNAAAATATSPPTGSQGRRQASRKRTSTPGRRDTRAITRSVRPAKSAFATSASDSVRTAEPRPRIERSISRTRGSAASARSTVSRSAAVSSPST